MSGVDSFYRVADFSGLYPSVIFGKKVKSFISYSEMNTYDQCLMKYMLNYVLGIKFFSVSDDVFVGTVIHKFLQDVVELYINKVGDDLYFDKKIYLSVIDETKKRYAELFESGNYSDVNSMVKTVVEYFYPKYAIRYDLVFSNVEFLRQVLPRMNFFTNYTKVSNLVNVGLRLLDGFFNRVCAGKRGFSILPEYRFEFHIKNSVKYMGFADLVVKFPDCVHIVDYKFGNPGYLKWHQLFYYSLAFDGIPSNKYLFVVKDSVIRVNQKSVSRTAIVDRLISYVDRILAFYDFYEKYRKVFSGEYNFIFSSILNDASEENYYEVPAALMAGIFRLVDGFFSSNAISYPNGETVLCPWCSYFSFCRVGGIEKINEELDEA